MNKKIIAALLAFASYGIQANAQAIIVTKSNDNKIVLPANNVKDITTTTDNLAESLDYYTKDEANNQLEELRKSCAANEMRIDDLIHYTHTLEPEINALKADMANKDMQIEKLKADMDNKDMQIYQLKDEMKNKDMQIHELTLELQDLREQIKVTRTLIEIYHQ